MKQMKKIFAFLLIATLMISMIACGKDKKEDKKTQAIEDRLMEAMTPLANLEGSHVLMDMSIDFDDNITDQIPELAIIDPEIFNMISNFDISAEVKSTMTNRSYPAESYVAYHVNYKSEPLLTVEMYSTKEGMQLGLTNLYPNTFFLNYSDLEDLVGEDLMQGALQGLDYQKYMDLVMAVDSSAIDQEAYTAVIKDHLKEVLTGEKKETLKYDYKGENFKEDLTVVTYEINMESILKMVESMIDIAKEDEALKDYIKEVAKVVGEELIASGDLEPMGVSEYDIQSILDMTDLLDQYWTMAFDQATAAMEEVQEEFKDMDEDSKEILDLIEKGVSLKFYLTDDNMIKKVAVHVDIKGIQFTVNTTLHATKDIAVNPPTNGINVLDLINQTGDYANEDNRNQLVADVLKSAMNEVSEGQAFKTLIQDLKPFEDMMGMTVEDIEMALSMANLFIDSMTYEDIMEMFNGGDDYDYDYEDEVDDEVIIEYQSDLNIALITDGGSINDGGFNQIALEGAQLFGDIYSARVTYYEPTEATDPGFLAAYQEAINDGHNVIIVPGFMQASALYQAQDLYPEVNFIILDALPTSSDFVTTSVSENTVSILFDEAEAGFLAGIAAALESQTGQIGFIGGMEITPVQKYYWGFAAGVDYANAHYGTEAQITQSIYQGSFSEVEAGASIASTMYDTGIDVIYSAAGGVSAGALSEAVRRGEEGQLVYYIGVDSDQYYEGLLSNGESVVLTSAIKRLDTAVYNMLEALAIDQFPGGETLEYGLAQYAVGLPAFNMNLTYETDDIIYEVQEKVATGEVTVPKTQDELDNFMK